MVYNLLLRTIELCCQLVVDSFCLCLSRLVSLPDSLQGDHAVLIKALFDWLVAPLLVFVHKQLRELVPTSDSNLVSSLMKLFQIMMKEDEENPLEQKYMKAWITVSLVWYLTG